MSNIPQHNKDEIDLLELLETVWKGKWAITSFIIIALTGTLIINIFIPNKIFEATTEIKPLPSTEIDKYKLYNSYLQSQSSFKQDVNEDEIIEIKIDEFFEISSDFLLNLFLEEIESGSIFEEGIRKFDLIKKDNYETQEEYNDAIIKFASKIQIIPPNKVTSYHMLKVKYDDSQKWKQFLKFTTDKTTEAVKKFINDSFNNSIVLAKQQKKFQIEDINAKIKIEMLNYENKNRHRLLFLKEQAAIARKLNFKNTKIELQLFDSQNKVINTVKKDNPFYFRGYEAIEEEIAQITSRSSNLSTIPAVWTLKSEVERIKANMMVERVEKLFLNSPATKYNFKSVLIKVPATKYKYKDKTSLYYLISVVIGGILGVIFVLIKNAFRNRKKFI